MNLTRPICFLDIEGTGLDPATDRIVELAVVKVLPDGLRTEHVRRINPGIPIPAEATAVHGISDADVEGKPAFKQVAASLAALLADCDIGGYNCLNYDVPLLWEEFYRAGREWDLTDVRIIDVGNLFKKKEPRDLTAAVWFYCNRTHEGAHGALADTVAVADVFQGQLARYPDLSEMDLARLADFSRLDEQPRIDLAGTLVRDAEGFAVYTHRRVRGVRVVDDTGYASWMLRQQFSQNTLKHVSEELTRAYEWIEAQLPTTKPVQI